VLDPSSVSNLSKAALITIIIAGRFLNSHRCRINVVIFIKPRKLLVSLWGDFGCEEE
jgi:hypothetical protein